MRTKPVVTLTAVLIVLFGLQMACSLTGIFSDNSAPAGAAAESSPQSPPEDSLVPEDEQAQTGAPAANHGNQNPGNQGNNQTGQNSCSNRASLVGSPSIPAGSQFGPGEDFVARWEIKNTGTCEWNSDYSVVLTAGDQLGASNPTPLSGTVAAGSSYFVTLPMTAPATEDSYVSLWKLLSDSGEIFGMDGQANNPLRVVIEVVQPTAAGNPPGANLTAMPLGTPNVTGPANTQPVVTAIPASSLFVESEADQVTLGEDECFDLINGTEVSCSSSAAHFKYDIGNDKILWGKNSLGWGDSASSELTKASCMGSTNFPDYFYITESTLLNYRCFKVTDGNNTYYGWVRVTYFNNNQITFDYLTYAP
ncbi:MAG: NBR1-Ig-like domain-containing protein [Chloroflexota bacterium]